MGPLLNGLDGYDLDSYGLDSYGLCSCGPYSYGLDSYGLCRYRRYVVWPHKVMTPYSHDPI